MRNKAAILLFSLGFLCAKVNQSFAQDSTFESLELWSDSVYSLYYQTGQVDHQLIDSVMFLCPPDEMSIGKEKLYRVLASYYHNLGKSNYAFPYLIEIKRVSEAEEILLVCL